MGLEPGKQSILRDICMIVMFHKFESQQLMALAWNLEPMKEHKRIASGGIERREYDIGGQRSRAFQRKYLVASKVAEKTNKIKIQKDPLDLTLGISSVTLEKIVSGEHVGGADEKGAEARLRWVVNAIDFEEHLIWCPFFYHFI